MPCPWSSRRCSRRAADDTTIPNALPSPTSTPDVEDWKKIRRFNLRMMRKQIRCVILLMALAEALRVGPLQIVYAGKHEYPAPGEDDYGIAYTVGYIVSWLYVCVFMIIWMPLFDWWVPKTLPASDDPSKSPKATKIICLLKKLNMILLPISIGFSCFTYVWYLIHTFIYVDSRTCGSTKFPKNTRKNWVVRAFFLLGIAITTSLGYGAFQTLEKLDLARVKNIEYALIVVPVQINLGILLGTVMQFRMEKRLARRQALKLQAAKVEDGVVEEKAALLEV
ncbi:uncharacterized protein Z520_00237 [Fonsecaea multimorphosa CBS 102226]|uniref:Uncharacterized protein n=1 Tax=Fonsecaea multimorphosa CBS 102226 TaxID=1442371 RepID=A0A0D2HNZ0_9EURO|nr:uncharacterized protein Z520_00237 [Fonsecaea multimorphosa CBS 102226]KIY03546.1 hypothetical protein Z520_00237 [Fonsecaea multimorphosa CBS 102226]OAL32250.1 hypothetical protein AYO22_00272 [Fonsecaea multimorphosa]